MTTEYIQIDTHEVVGEGTIRSRFSTWPFSTPMLDSEALTVRYAPITKTSQPSYDPATQTAPIEITPIQDANGVWFQQWAQPLALTPDQIAALVPQYISRGQALEALLSAGLLTQVQTYIASQPQQVQIAFSAWDKWWRQSPMLQTIAMACSITNTQLDALFTAAASIQL